jgi:hypothetical protein
LIKSFLNILFMFIIWRSIFLFSTGIKSMDYTCRLVLLSAELSLIETDSLKKMFIFCSAWESVLLTFEGEKNLLTYLSLLYVGCMYTFVMK